MQIREWWKTNFLKIAFGFSASLILIVEPSHSHEKTKCANGMGFLINGMCFVQVYQQHLQPTSPLPATTASGQQIQQVPSQNPSNIVWQMPLQVQSQTSNVIQPSALPPAVFEFQPQLQYEVQSRVQQYVCAGGQAVTSDFRQCELSGTTNQTLPMVHAPVYVPVQPSQIQPQVRPQIQQQGIIFP